MKTQRECKHKKEYFTCKRMRLLEYLLEKGFYPAAIVPEIENPRFKNWKFKNTPELELAIEEYFKDK